MCFPRGQEAQLPPSAYASLVAGCLGAEARRQAFEEAQGGLEDRRLGLPPKPVDFGERVHRVQPPSKELDDEKFQG